MKIHKYIIFVFSILVFPSITFAAFTGTIDLINAFGGLVKSLIPILIGLALAVFFWGLVKFIFRVGGDEKAVEEGKRIMIWGIIALFVMVSIWGIIGLIQKDLNLNVNSNSGNTSGGGGGAPLPTPIGGINQSP